MGPGDLGLPAGIASDNMAPPTRWEEIDRSVMPKFAPALAVDDSEVRDRPPQCRLLSEAERGLLQQRRRVLTRIAVPAGSQAEMRAVVTVAQLMAPIDERCHLLAGNAPQDFVPELRVGNRLVEHQHTHHFE